MQSEKHVIGLCHIEVQLHLPVHLEKEIGAQMNMFVVGLDGCGDHTSQIILHFAIYAGLVDLVIHHLQLACLLMLQCNKEGLSKYCHKFKNGNLGIEFLTLFFLCFFF